MIIAIELQAAIDSAGTVVDLYLCTDGFVTTPNDTPPNVAFLDRLVEPGAIGLRAIGDSVMGGNAALEIGEIVIANADGELDQWIEWSFDGRPIVIRAGTDGREYPAGWTTLMVGTLESVDAGWDTIVLRLRDRQWMLTVPALSVRYSGTNVLPDGVEGTEADIAGQLKPMAVGRVFGVSPPCVNTARLIYEVGPCNSVDGVYDRGAALTLGTDYPSLTALEGATTASSTFDTCVAEGYFRLGATPAGIITADVTEGATIADRTVAQLLKRLALAAGFSGSDIAAADVTALDAAAPYETGIWLHDDTQYLVLMETVAMSVGAWFGVDALGMLRMGMLDEPSGDPVATIYDFDILEGFQRRQPRGGGIPIWRVVLGYRRNWNPMPLDLAGALTAAERAALQQEFRRVTAEDASVKTQWLLAGEITDEVHGGRTLLTTEADAQAEADRRLALHSVRRDLFEVPVSLATVPAGAITIGDVVELRVERFGLNAGRLLQVLGVRYELRDSTVILTLWG